ncbi:coiled-coil domain-containing protein [Pedobacter hiemivivus]|uniref:Rad50/SbcC-type AAA domain-containing protein n=1 Tax=Pedobacter hiemivivus TaxID=2530454 RepID=A0A4R0NG95_9SPHI|nr:hypothetical protein [Pedobacter hiemivivus]TCC99541.1 hypothetical protein EZ444_02370 [Pedobacter hiemivivus]
MQSLKFERLLVLSDSNKSANRFQFSPRLNLITAKDNSVGKSTLAKLLFWALGCPPVLDTKWADQDSKTIIDFKIGEQKYSIKRYKNLMELKVGNELPIKFDKITGEYSEKMAKLLNFKVLLPNKSSRVLEVPSPAYYFLPFYIDQKKSWSEAWNNFEGFQQYADWKSTVIKYHVGLLTPGYFELELEKYQKSNQQNQINEGINKINIALEIVEDYIPEVKLSTFNNQKFEAMTHEIRVDLESLEKTQESLLHEFVLIQGEKSYLQKQKEISEGIISNLQDDYKFAVENILGDELECPLCGTFHTNTLADRASIMTDLAQAEKQLSNITSDIQTLEQRIAASQEDLSTARSQIQSINEKYVISDEGVGVTYGNIIKRMGADSLRENVQADKDLRLLEVTTIEGEIKDIKKTQAGLLTLEEKKVITDDFIAIFSKFIDLLGAEAVNLSKIKSPLDYAKIIKEGGAAEGSRAILAYYLTIYSLVNRHAKEVNAPLVIDTPNQHEQSSANYDKIIKILTSELNQKSQIFLCAMDNPQLSPYAEKANVITLDKSKLLSLDQYEEVKNLFDNWYKVN